MFKAISQFRQKHLSGGKHTKPGNLNCGASDAKSTDPHLMHNDENNSAIVVGFCCAAAGILMLPHF